MRILLADKDPYDLQAMRAELEAPGVEIVTARDGRDVLALVAEQPPDVVVVASSLGQMGGFAVARQLKMDAEVSGQGAAKIAVLLEREADRWLAGWSRCDAFATKPLRDGELSELLATLTSGDLEASAT